LFEIAVRARKSPWIETPMCLIIPSILTSGLVRARGLKQTAPKEAPEFLRSGLVRARGLKLESILDITICIVRARKSPWIET